MRKVATLSDEDLARWRLVSADKDLVDNLFPGFSVEEARRVTLTFYKTLGDLVKAYNMDTDVGSIFLSPIDGGFYTGVSILD